MVVMGFGFSLIAHFLSRKATPLSEARPAQPNEGWVLALVVAYITLIIIPGNKPLLALLPDYLQDSEPEREIITMVRKMITLVAVPFLIYHFFFRFRPADFGLSSDWRKALTGRHLVIFLGMALTLASFNYFAGSGAKPLREGLLSGQQLLIGIPLLFAWDFFEVGLGEEFLFRGIIQNRLAVLLKSPWGSIFVSAFIFGVVHAPGMYLRGAGVIEGLGGSPSLLTTISYCIAVQSVTGIFFGIIWLSTRNLWILMGIHAVTDLVPHLYGFVTAWGI
jgi:membrane protease YdiL (CAAX protease family)